MLISKSGFEVFGSMAHSCTKQDDDRQCLLGFARSCGLHWLYIQKFHDFTLKLHIILSSLTLFILKTYQMQPKQADNQEARFLGRQSL